MRKLKRLFGIYRHSFQLRILLALVLVSFIFIPTMGYVSFLQGKKSVQNQIRQYTVSTAHQITERVEAFLLHPVYNVRLIKNVLENDLPITRDTHKLSAYFHRLQQEHPEFLNINYGDKHGRFTMVPPQRPEVHKLFDPRIRPWYKGAVAREGVYWTKVYVFASSQNPGITASVPILEQDGKVAGVCAIDLDLSTLSRFLTGIQIGRHGNAYIIENDRHRVIAHPDLLNLHFEPEQIKFLSVCFTNLKAQNKQFSTITYEGKEFATAFAEYPQNNWTIGVTVPLSDFLEEINYIKNATLTVVLAAILMSGALSWLLATTIVKPLKSLETGIKRATAGDLDYQLQLKDPDVVASVATAFNQMAASLKRNREALKNSYVELAEKKKLAALGQLTAGIAHEIKNPLGVILGAAEVVAGQKRPMAMREKAASFIVDEVMRLNDTLKAFLAFAKPAPPKLQTADLGQLMLDILTFYRTTLDQQAIEVRTVFDAGLPECRVDPFQIRQVFANLILNTRQAMPQGGILTVKLEPRAGIPPFFRREGQPVHTALSEAGRKSDGWSGVLLTVADTGTGIEAERLEKIFEPFVTFRDDGTGLGLSIVAQILRHHNAGIHVESDVGQGTTFSLFFPLTNDLALSDPVAETGLLPEVKRRDHT